MRRTHRLLIVLSLAAVAVPLIPFLLFGTRLDHAVARWLDPRPAPAVFAAFEIALLAVDLLLPVPSSMVATLGGAELGIAAGTACAWLGMTAGAVAGWWLGRTMGGRALGGVEQGELAALERRRRQLGPLFVVLSRPLPLVAEAAAIVAGGTGMRLREFLPAAAAGNLAIALVWTFAGATGARADALQWAVVASLALPALAAWLAGRSRFWQDRAST